MSQVRTERRVEGAQTFRAGARRPLVAQPREFLDAGRPDGRVRVGARRGAVPLDAVQRLERPAPVRSAVARRVRAVRDGPAHEAARRRLRGLARTEAGVEEDLLLVVGVGARAARQPVDLLLARRVAEALDPVLLDAHVGLVLLPVRDEVAHVVDVNGDHHDLRVVLLAEVVQLAAVR